MKTKEVILKALDDMIIRQKSYALDMFSQPVPNEVVYHTEIIRKLEVTNATIHTLKWVLGEDVPVVEPKKQCTDCQDGSCQECQSKGKT